MSPESTVTILVVAVSNAGALVWGAATMRSELKYLREEVSALKAEFHVTAKVLQTTLSAHDIRLALLEAKGDSHDRPD